MTDSTVQNKRQRIAHELKRRFSPHHIEVVDESDRHNVPPDSESHFKVTIVASEFEQLNLVKRHQAVYSVLSQLMQEGIHALALHTLSPQEWHDEKRRIVESPPCLGGSAPKN